MSTLIRSLGALLVGAGLLAAQPGGGPSITLTEDIVFHPTAAINSTANELGFTEAETTLQVRDVLDGGHFYQVTAGARFTFYNFEANDEPINDLGELWDDVTGVNLEGLYRHRLNDSWAAVGILGVRAASEDGADLTDGLTLRAALGGAYQVNRGLEVGLGIFYQDRLEDDALIIPYILIEWQINERTRLTTRNGAFLTYQLNEERTQQLDAGISWTGNSFRLDDGRNDLLAGGAVDEDRFDAIVGYTYRFANGFAVRAYTGMAFAQEFDLFTEAGDEVDFEATYGIEDFETDARFIFGIEASIRF